MLLFHFNGVNCAILFVNPHRGLFFVVGRSQRCEAPARPVYVFQYMWHPRRAVRLCAIVPDPHPTGVVIMWGCRSAQALSLAVLAQHLPTIWDSHPTGVFTDNARIVPTVVRCWALFPYRSTTRRQAQGPQLLTPNYSVLRTS